MVLALAAVPVLLYALNPYGTSTLDPRARVLGFTTFRIVSGSMEPTLIKDDLILVKASAYAFEEPKIGDVIVFRYPEDRSVAFVFRVVAKEGDVVKIVDGNTVVNGIELDEPYVQFLLANSVFWVDLPDKARFHISGAGAMVSVGMVLLLGILAGGVFACFRGTDSFPRHFR